jgi:hypothetical protein
MALRGRRPVRTAANRGAGEIGSALELRDRHLLLVPSTLYPGDVADLVLARVPGSDLGRTGEVSLGRFSRLSGPYELSMEDAVDAAVPMPWTVAYALTAPVEREDPPIPGLDDRDGFARAFPQGMPWREEGRALHLLVALARRTQGAVRTAGGGAMIQPDPDRAVDLIIHSPYWLDPEVLLGVVQRALPSARLEVEGTDWNGPSDEVYSGQAIAPLTAAAPISPYDLARLHHSADQYDMARLAAEDCIDAFAIAGDLGPGGEDGAIEVLVNVGRDREPAVADQPWAQNPFVTYQLRWSSLDWEERERRLPSAGFRASRARVQPVVRAVARVIIEATGGVVTDEDGFWLDRYSL